MADGDFETWLDSIVPNSADARDAAPIRRIIAAREALEAALADAHREGIPAVAIAVGLGKPARSLAWERYMAENDPPSNGEAL